jgi:hypothetical protein
LVSFWPCGNHTSSALAIGNAKLVVSGFRKHFVLAIEFGENEWVQIHDTPEKASIQDAHLRGCL